MTDTGSPGMKLITTAVTNVTTMTTSTNWPRRVRMNLAMGVRLPWG